MEINGNESTSMTMNIFTNVATLEISKFEKRDSWILLSGSAENVLFKAKLYLLIFILSLNFIGNSLIIALMRRARFQRASYSIYFTVVALADIGVGICGDLNAILLMNDVNVEIISHFACRLRAFVLSVCQQLSGCGLSALSVDRCIAICLSHKSQVRSDELDIGLLTLAFASISTEVSDKKILLIFFRNYC